MVNVVKSPRVSAKDFQKSLAHAVIIVDRSTIGKTLNKNGVHRTPRRKPLVSKKPPLLQDKIRHFLEWPSPSPDLNPTEMLLPDLRRAIHSKRPKNIAELKQFCRDENSSCLLLRAGLQLQEMFGWRSCCQRRVNQLLNPKVHRLFPPCTVNVYMLCSIKTWKLILFLCSIILSRLCLSSDVT